jgi:uncharacterized membrane protein
MVAFAAWIRSTPMPGFSLALQKTALSMFIAMTPYVIPILQTIHIYAVSMLFVGFIMLNGRLFMVANRSRTLAQTMDRFMPWVWWCLLVLLITGVLMAVGEPPRDLQNPAFWTKMMVVPTAALLTLWFQTSMRRHIVAWDTPRGGPAAVKAASVGFLLLWMVIMALGRWIAYVPT